MANATRDLLDECKKQVKWLEHIKPQIQAPVSVMYGLDMSIKYLNQAIRKAEASRS